jgi:excisionase family DNA binding protein
METITTTIDNHKLNNERKTITSEVTSWKVQKIATELSVSIKTVKRLIDDGVLPVVRIRGCIRVPKQAILDWIKAQTRYNSGCVGSAVQGASTCHISASKREVKASSGGYRSPMQTANELESLLEQRKRGKL